MKETLKKIYLERQKELFFVIRNLEDEFINNGCPICGSAHEGNGKWKLYGKQYFSCPHLQNYIKKKIKKEILQQNELLNYLKTSSPMDDILLFSNLTLSEEFIFLKSEKIKFNENNSCTCCEVL